MAEPNNHANPRYLIFDCESIPDGKLLNLVKYADHNYSPEEAIVRAQEEARAVTPNSDFLPVTFQIPVAICVLRIGADLCLQAIRCLDGPHFRSRKMVEDFWKGLNHYGNRIQLVTFNGRCFDLPLLELAAFRYGFTCGDYFSRRSRRYETWHFDLMD